MVRPTRGRLFCVNARQIDRSDFSNGDDGSLLLICPSSFLIATQRIAVAKSAGVYRGRKPSLTADLRKRVASGGKKAALAREFGISRETVYQYLHA
jgi:hypothetical protein